MSYCVRLKPDQQNVLMAGTQDKKIVQWDMDSGDLVQVSKCFVACCVFVQGYACGAGTPATWCSCRALPFFHAVSFRCIYVGLLPAGVGLKGTFLLQLQCWL
jgi:hypothetical protein